MIPLIGHSGKSKVIETENRLGAARDQGWQGYSWLQRGSIK